MKVTRNSWSFVAATSDRSLSKREALITAEKYGLREEISYLLDNGYTPNEALAEWDIL